MRYVCGPGPTQELRLYENTGGSEAPEEGPVSSRCDKHRVGFL